MSVPCDHHAPVRFNQKNFVHHNLKRAVFVTKDKKLLHRYLARQAPQRLKIVAAATRPDAPSDKNCIECARNCKRDESISEGVYLSSRALADLEKLKAPCSARSVGKARSATVPRFCISRCLIPDFDRLDLE